MKLICGPMATLSHEAFRRSVEEFGGCDEYFTEMINAPSLINMGPFEKYYLLNEPCPQKIVWQLTGTQAEPLAQAACIVTQKGGIGVDINMGCSAAQIYKTGAGIAWMLKPLEQTREAVRQVKNALLQIEQREQKHYRLSVKCRLGGEDFTESSFYTFTDMLVEEGVELITLHPRTIKEKCSRPPKYEYVEKLALRYQNKIPIVLNGGVNSIQTALHAQNVAPHANAIMIARAAAQKPWIFAQIKKELQDLLQDLQQDLQQSLQQEQQGLLQAQSDLLQAQSDLLQAQSEYIIDCQKVALDFIQNVQLYQPQEFWKTRIQRFFAYYCLNFSFGHYFQTQMLNAKSIEECKTQILDYFAKESADRFKKY